MISCSVLLRIHSKKPPFSLHLVSASIHLILDFIPCSRPKKRHICATLFHGTGHSQSAPPFGSNREPTQLPVEITKVMTAILRSRVAIKTFEWNVYRVIRVLDVTANDGTNYTWQYYTTFPGL